MTTMTKVHSSCLSEALAKILGKPSAGTMAYIRCLSSEVINELCSSTPLQLSGWDVYAVAGLMAQGERFITADRAVDLREEKQGSIILLVEQKEAGAGMDGIYSAVREIGERELFDTANKIVLRKLPKKNREFAQQACREARSIGRGNSISPWREFDFYAQCVAEPDGVGEHIAMLGLWPIQTVVEPRKEDLGVAARVTERLLLPASAANTISARIESLLLPVEAEQQIKEMESFLRETDDLRWTDAVIKARSHRSLWLNNVIPGFISQELKSIALVSWRTRPDGPLFKWSGLTLEGENVSTFLLDETNKERSKLQVKWQALPKDLKAGAVEYKVSIITGGDSELVARQVTHSGKETQQCVFNFDDFDDEEIDRNGKWEVKVRVHPIGEQPPEEDKRSDRWKESEEFILTFGTKEIVTRNSVGKKVRALVEEAIKLAEEEFDLACRETTAEDAQGYVGYRVSGKSGRVYRPPLIKVVEEGWQQNGFQIGRWIVRVREEGSRVGAPEFQQIKRDDGNADAWRRLEHTTRLMAQKAMGRWGFIGLIHHSNDTATTYVNAWADALESNNPQLALANTIEVQSLSGKTLGLIVLPSHPLRVAWHQAYDELARHAKYSEGLKAVEVVKMLKVLDGSYMPAFLPGLAENSSFVFGDTLGFYAVAMLRHDEKEPQAIIAQMARCLSSAREDVAPSVGITTASAIAREIDKYTDLHPHYSTLRVNALRPGDGQTVARALGLTLKTHREEKEESERLLEKPGYLLDLFPSSPSSVSRVVGRFLSETAERRRAGVGAVSAEDRWMLDTYEVAGITMPRLKWAKRGESQPTEPVHLSVAFDTFKSTVELLSEKEIESPRPIEAFGLMPSLVRRFSFEPLPTWTTTIAPQVEGEKHPVSRSLSDRLQKIQSAVMRSVAANLGGNRPSWPVLKTQLTADQADAVKRLHELSDWVITIDRNAGIEYFDAPHDAAEVYETYVIDCVPERQDLDCVQLVTSTSNIQEVMRLLDKTLTDMALSCSPRNCNFLLSQLKAISGRLAMRLANQRQSRGEMIALAMFNSNCENSNESREWLSLKNGFFVPLDDVRELLLGSEKEIVPSSEDEEPASNLRADLVYVDLSRRGTLQFTFIEVKYRRLFKSALDGKLHSHIYNQISRTRERWMESYFSGALTQTQLVMSRKRLARALRFYLDKARRHHLSEQANERMSSAIDRLFRSDAEISPEPVEDRGYIFCPEFVSGIQEIEFNSGTKLYIFGPQGLPDLPLPVIDPYKKALVENAEESAVNLQAEPSPSGTDSFPANHHLGNGSAIVDATGLSTDPDVTSKSLETQANINIANVDSPSSGEILLNLGHTLAGEVPVKWNLSIKGNPHLMIVGLPGMGKTTCIINLCEQLVRHGVTPLIFSYHDDIEEKLNVRLGALNFADIDNGLGFNPMRVVTSSVHGWLDNVGMLRDIFASVYSDLGDLQTNEIREAIKQSYTELGFGISSAQDLPMPEFQRFFDIIKSKPKPNPGVIARLEELNDYGFFRSTNKKASLLETREPTIIRLYSTQNETLQKATSSFVLLNIYQNMFLRGNQPALAHAVIFDEAHRASRLKLLPTMAKECRKYGLSLIVASQEGKDFDPSLYAAIANYLVLRVSEPDAKALAKNVSQSSEASSISGRLKQMSKYTAMFFCEGKRPTSIKLLN